jgi:hypothetical protein
MDPLFARNVVPLDAQRRPCIFCGRPTAYYKRCGVDVFAHVAPSCKPFSSVLEQLANHVQQASEELLREALEVPRARN